MGPPLKSKTKSFFFVIIKNLKSSWCIYIYIKKKTCRICSSLHLCSSCPRLSSWAPVEEWPPAHSSSSVQELRVSLGTCYYDVHPDPHGLRRGGHHVIEPVVSLDTERQGGVWALESQDREPLIQSDQAWYSNCYSGCFCSNARCYQSGGVRFLYAFPETFNLQGPLQIYTWTYFELL